MSHRERKVLAWACLLKLRPTPRLSASALLGGRGYENWALLAESPGLPIASGFSLAGSLRVTGRLEGKRREKPGYSYPFFWCQRLWPWLCLLGPTGLQHPQGYPTRRLVMPQPPLSLSLGYPWLPGVASCPPFSFSDPHHLQNQFPARNHVCFHQYWFPADLMGSSW